MVAASGENLTLPCFTVMDVAVFFGREPDIFFKGLYKMALGRECEVICNFDQADVRVLEKVLRLLYFFLPDVITYGDTEILLKKTREVTRRQFCMISEFVDGDALVDMAVDIIGALDNGF